MSCYTFVDIILSLSFIFAIPYIVVEIGPKQMFHVKHHIKHCCLSYFFISLFF
jgi:hypothetical protein